MSEKKRIGFGGRRRSFGAKEWATIVASTAAILKSLVELVRMMR